MVKTPHDYPIYGNPIMSFKCFITNIKSEDCSRFILWDILCIMFFFIDDVYMLQSCVYMITTFVMPPTKKI